MTATRVRPGQILRLQEPDYLYGTGELKLRVRWIDPNPHPNIEWLLVVGIEIRWDGSDGERREVLVRANALPLAGGPRRRDPTC